MAALDEIIEKHHIEEIFDNAKKMDKENRIFISKNFVIKIYYPKKFQYYYNELEVYQSLENKDYLAKLNFFGEEKAYKYIVISRLQGRSLFDSWDSYTSEQKECLITQIATILKDINNIRIDQTNFKSILNDKFLSVISSLNYSSDFIDYLKAKYDELSQYLDDIELSNLIHIDVHFYNFFVNEGKVFAYDFENTILAPLDYQLLRWFRMWKYPDTFIYPKNSLSDEQKETYRIIMPDLIRAYPELLNNPNSEERVKLYSLVYLLEEANRCNLSEETTKKYIKENREIILKG